jgi:drug/metabolite transporter (DMT)-like permease
MRFYPMPEKSRITIATAYLVLCVVWSSTWLVIRIGLKDLPPVSFVATRFVIAIALLLLISVGRVRLLPERATDFALLAYTGLLMFGVNYTLVFWGELYVSSGLSAVLQATIPIFGMVFAHFILPSEPLRWQRMAGAALAICGVAVICSKLFDFGGIMALWGGIGLIIAAASAAFSNVMMKKRGLQMAPAMIAAWQMIFGVAPLLVAGFLIDGNPLRLQWTKSALLSLLYLAVVGSALTFLLLYWLLPRMSVTKLQTISLITPPGAVILGWLLGGETFSAWSLAGGALVLAGVWMIFRNVEAPPVINFEARNPKSEQSIRI